MYKWLLLAAVLCVVAGEQAADQETSESVNIGIRAERPGEDIPPWTKVYREVHPSGHPLPQNRIQKQNEIVLDRYSPTYYQPTWILDYRYLKSGGRDYVRNDGGQIMILPKGVRAKDHGYKEYGNYDELLEHLRLQELAEKEKLRLERTRKPQRQHEHIYEPMQQHHLGRMGKIEEPLEWRQQNEMREGGVKDINLDMLLRDLVENTHENKWLQK